MHGHSAKHTWLAGNVEAPPLLSEGTPHVCRRSMGFCQRNLPSSGSSCIASAIEGDCALIGGARTECLASASFCLIVGMRHLGI